MSMPWKDLHGAAKVLVICLTVLLVAGGLCGVQSALLSGARFLPDSWAEVFIVTGVIELIAMLASVVVGFIALLVWGFGSMFRRDREP